MLAVDEPNEMTGTDLRLHRKEQTTK
jgi:hypothetical protein